jgi:aquaporin rerated protein, other eukaryote
LKLTEQVGEFVGTTMFLFLSFGGTHVANLPGATVTSQSSTKFINTSNLMFISLSFGMSLIINVWIFFRVSGALFNPAISLALALAQVITPLRATFLFIAQIIGGICAAALIDGLMPGPINFTTTLSGGISISQGTSSSV